MRHKGEFLLSISLQTIMEYRKQLWGLMVPNTESTQRPGNRVPGIVLWVNTFSERHPRGYLTMVTLLMLPGFSFLLLFPFLAFEGASVLIRELPNVNTMEHWLVVEVWFAIILFCLFFSQQIFQLHFPRTQGLKLSKALAPGLYTLIAEVRKYTEPPEIRNIVLTDQYELRIEETPRFGYPFLMSRTLVVGMPMLQTLSEEQFRGEVLRKIGQYSSGRLRLTHWIYRVRLLWCKYHDALQKRKRIGELPMRWFFSFYAPLFAMISIPAARQDELVADTVVLEWLNDRDYFETVKCSTIAEIFLDEHYWRNVYQSALKNPQLAKKALNPFEKLEHISGHLKSKDFRRKWLQKALEADQDITKAAPSLRTRMDNIGQSALRDVPIVEKTAAVVCLGEARKNYVPIIDKLWRSTTFTQWKMDYDKRREDFAVVKRLSRKSQKQVLNIREVIRYARIAKRLRGDPLRRSVRKLIKRNLKNTWIVSLGRKLIHRKLKTAHQANDII